MATKITAYRSEQGTIHENEIDAIRVDTRHRLSAFLETIDDDVDLEDILLNRADEVVSILATLANLQSPGVLNQARPAKP